VYDMTECIPESDVRLKICGVCDVFKVVRITCRENPVLSEDQHIHDSSSADLTLLTPNSGRMIHLFIPSYPAHPRECSSFPIPIPHLRHGFIPPAPSSVVPRPKRIRHVST
jgi:hypothetical protein